MPACATPPRPEELPGNTSSGRGFITSPIQNSLTDTPRRRLSLPSNMMNAERLPSHDAPLIGVVPPVEDSGTLQNSNNGPAGADRSQVALSMSRSLGAATGLPLPSIRATPPPPVATRTRASPGRGQSSVASQSLTESPQRTTWSPQQRDTSSVPPDGPIRTLQLDTTIPAAASRSPVQRATSGRSSRGAALGSGGPIGFKPLSIPGRNPQRKRSIPHQRSASDPPAAAKSNEAKSSESSSPSCKKSTSALGSFNDPVPPTEPRALPASRSANNRSTASLDEPACCICLEAYSEDNPKCEGSCGHHFHIPCLLSWKQRSNVCPLCCSETLTGVGEMDEPEHPSQSASLQSNNNNNSRSNSNASPESGSPAGASPSPASHEGDEAFAIALQRKYLKRAQRRQMEIKMREQQSAEAAAAMQEAEQRSRRTNSPGATPRRARARGQRRQEALPPVDGDISRSSSKKGDCAVM